MKNKDHIYNTKRSIILSALTERCTSIDLRNSILENWKIVIPIADLKEMLELMEKAGDLEVVRNLTREYPLYSLSKKLKKEKK